MEQIGVLEIIIGTVASVAATIFTVLGAIFYLDRKMDATRRELSGEIGGVRDASQSAHTQILGELSDIKGTQKAYLERFKCIESHLRVGRTED